VAGVTYEVDAELAGETVVVWWGLFDQELWVEREEERFGPYHPVGGPIPLHRYRKHRKSRREVRADRVGDLARLLVLPRSALSGEDDVVVVGVGPTASADQVPVRPFLDPDPFHELTFPTPLAAKRAIADEIRLPIGKLSEDDRQFIETLVAHPKLKNDLRRPQMEEIGDRTTVFEFGGLRDRQRDCIDWVLNNSVEEGVAPEDIITDAAATRLAAKLKTPLQIGQHLVRAFETGFEVGAKPVDETVVEAVLSLRIDDLEPRLTRSGYDVRRLVEQFDAKPAEIRRLLRGDLDPARSRELLDEMRAAGLPT
jgi:hypothetical protein